MDGVMVVEKLVAEDLNHGVGTTRVTAPAGGTFLGHQMNLSVLGIGYIGSWTPGAVPAGGAVDTVIPMAGASPGNGDPVMVGFSEPPQNCLITAFASATDQVTVRAVNPTAGVITLGSGTLKVVLFPMPPAHSLLYRPGS